MNPEKFVRRAILPVLLLFPLSACKPQDSQPPPPHPIVESYSHSEEIILFQLRQPNSEILTPTESNVEEETLLSTPTVTFPTPLPTATLVTTEAPLNIPEVPPTPTLKPYPTIPVEALPTPAPEIQLTNLEKEMFAAINAERAKFDQSELTIDSQLVEIARIRSLDMAEHNYFSHHNPNDGQLAFVKLLEERGIPYSRAGENLARNNVADNLSVPTALDGFMNSGTHRANILNPNYRQMGVGSFTQKDGMKYLTLIFLAP